LIIKAFDPFSGQQKELVRLVGRPDWALSPDGSFLAVLTGDRNGGEIRFIPLGGGPPRAFPIKGYKNLWTVDWAGNSKSVFTEAGWQTDLETLLRIDLSGHMDCHAVAEVISVMSDCHAG
jgi:hypothetical protein